MAGQVCVPGLLSACLCADGSQGTQVCDVAGLAFAACQCGTAMTIDSAGPPGGIAGASGPAGGGLGGSTSVPQAGAGAATANAGMGGETGAMPDQPGALSLARNISIAEIALYQAVKVSLAKAGESVIARNAPVIVGKEAFVRVFVAPGPGFVARELTVELTLVSSEGPAQSQTRTQRVQGPSSDAALDSTINFQIPGDQVTADLRYAVALRETAAAAPSGSPDPAARFPLTVELQPLEPREAGPLRVLLVPYRYQGDGSGRLPVTDDAQLALFQQYLRAYYPASDIQIELHDPVDYDAQLTPSAGWEQFLDTHCALRTAESPDPKLLYYGLIAPREDVRAYGGGVYGISYVPGPSANFGRCSVGVGFEGPPSASTMAHELGHSLGLPHAPCGTSGGPYPYTDAKIGVWGYSVNTQTLKDPGEYHDLMSYCDPVFISDFNFQQLFERIRYLNLQFSVVPQAKAAYARVLVDTGGRASYRGRIELDQVPGGPEETRSVGLFDEDGRSLGEVDAYYFPFSQGQAGQWLIPELGASSARIAAGARVALR